MNVYIIAAMAVLGIGGGFSGLAWGWREGLRESSFMRHYCGQVLIDGRWAEISNATDFDLKSGEYIQISGSTGMNGVYLFRWSEWT